MLHVLFHDILRPTQCGRYYYDSMFSDGELGPEMKMYMQLLYIKVGIKARSDLPNFVFLISRWHNLYRLYRTSLVAQVVKRLHTMQERLGFNSRDRKILWSRKWHPTPVPLPGKSYGRRSMIGYSPWGRKESETTETSIHFTSLYRLQVAHPATEASQWPLEYLLLPSVINGNSIMTLTKENMASNWKKKREGL